MAALRSLCLPRLSFLLLSVLQNSTRHQEALRLADIISSDQHRLYQVSTTLLRTGIENINDLLDLNNKIMCCFGYSGFLKRGTKEVSSEVEGVVTLSVGPRA